MPPFRMEKASITLLPKAESQKGLVEPAAAQQRQDDRVGRNWVVLRCYN